jgi:hypothetical protein
MMIGYTCEHRSAVRRMVPHDVEGLVAGQPLGNGVPLTRQNHAVGVSRHERVYQAVQQRKLIRNNTHLNFFLF